MFKVQNSAFGRGVAAFCVAGALGFGAVSAQADILQFDQGGLYSPSYDYGGMGTGRGIGFVVDQDFSITSVGINLGVNQDALGAEYVFSIYSSTNGSDAGSVLASTSFNDLALGEGWVDRALNFSFSTGSFYVVNFGRADDGYLQSLGTIYSWEDQGAAPFDYGPLTVLDGFEGAPPNNGNPLVPHMRFNASVGAVPEPATWAMMIVGFGAVGASIRSRRRHLAVA
jgi:hypothetical protein